MRPLTLVQARRVLALYAKPPRPIATQGFLEDGSIAVQAVLPPGQNTHHFWVIASDGQQVEQDHPLYDHLPWAKEGGWVPREELLALARQAV